MLLYESYLINNLGRASITLHQTLSKAPVVSLSKKHYPPCLVLVGSRNGFDRYFTIKLK